MCVLPIIGRIFHLPHALSSTPLRLQGWCSLHDVDRLKHLLVKLGLLRRVLAPQAVLRGHERAIRTRMRYGFDPTTPEAHGMVLEVEGGLEEPPENKKPQQ
jgi:hypothetical protein